LKDLKHILIVRYTLLVAAALVAISLLIIIPVRSNTLEQEIDNLKVDARLLARELQRFFVEVTPYSEVDDYIEFLASDLSIRLTLIDTQGSVLGDSQFPAEEMESHLNRSEVAAALDGEVESSIRESRTLGRDFIYVAAPVQVDGEIVGVVRAALAEEDFTPLVLQVWWIILIAFGILLAVIVAVSMWTERTILRGLKEMREAASALAAGDLTRRVAEPDIRDFAELARGFNDMAEQIRRIVEEAAAEKGKLEAVLNNVSAGVMVTDPDGIIILINPAAETMLGIEPEKAWGKRVVEAFPSSELDLIVSRAIAGEKVEEEVELVYLKKAVFHVKSNPVIASDGSALAVVSAIEDVTATKHLDRVRRDFVANVSHELRTPVASIKALTDSLLGGALEEPETGKRFLTDLSKETTRLAQLIEDLLTLGRLEAEGTVLKMEQLSLEGLAKERLESKEKLAEKYDVTMEIKVSGTSRIIHADSRLLGTALDNLLDNAIKYNNPGGKIVINCLFEEQKVTLRVEDSGIGIPRDELPRVFERFYRVDKARSRETGGTGLGLSIVKHVADLHGGTVTVESVEDEGSEFSIHIPSIPTR
jgi:two-component system phosphate regulon sensor histidine kinase PhoR